MIMELQASRVVESLERTFGPHNVGTVQFDNMNTAWYVVAKHSGTMQLLKK